MSFSFTVPHKIKITDGISRSRIKSLGADYSETRRLIMEENKSETLEDGKETCHAEDDQTVTVLRRSDRERRQTERMVAYQEELNFKQKRALDQAFQTWRDCTRQIRHHLKEDCSESELGEMVDTIHKMEAQVLSKFEDLKNSSNMQPDKVKRVDACVAVTADMLKLINERLSGLVEFNKEIEMNKLSQLKEYSYAQSVFSATTEMSNKTNVSEKVADAAADLAAKQAEYELFIEEQRQRAMIAKLEANHQSMINQQYEDLKRLESKRNLSVAKARLTAYARVMNYGNVSQNEPSIEDVYKDEGVKCKLEFDPSVTNNAEPDAKRESREAMDVLAKALADTVNLNRLPIPEPNMFSGDPLQFIEWKASFMTLIDRKGIPAEEKIFYLKKYTGGAARQAIDGFFYSSSSSTYDLAWEVLEERYGHPFIVQKAFRARLENWPKVAPKDSIGLRDFADFLRSCRDAVPRVSGLRVLDDCNENQKLMQKLPDWASIRWNREVTQTLETYNSYPTFSQFVDFVVKEAKVACNPVSSSYALTDQEKKSRDTRSNKFNGGVRVLAASTDCGAGSVNKDNLSKPPHCEFCEKDNHFIVKCDKFLSLTLEKKRESVREKKLCFGCLRRGHMSKDCKRRHTCATCKGKHPTCLHEERPTASNGQSEHRSFNHSVSAPTNAISTSMIVPVWVSSEENPAREILTYAMLDTQSDTTFILEETSRALELKGQRVKLSLSTMTSQNTSLESSRVTGLKVRAFNSANSVTVKQAYTRDFIPVDRSHIPQRDVVKGWPHLAPVADQIQPLQSCEVGLLIGYNCPQALAPRDVIFGREEDPYAVQTLLGWSVVGCTKQCYGDTNSTGACHRTMVNVKELPVCSPKDVIKVLERDFACDGSKEGKVSQDDIHFLSILDNQIQRCEDGHLEMPLPFRQRPNLPNNKSMALIRLNHLKRKMKNQKYYDDYKRFMHGVIKKGEAEQVTNEGTEGNVWYIPHHGVYHSQKPDKIRVVFDCSARYANTSLNQHLLTGPDLTNRLVGVLCRFRQYPVAIMGDIEGMFHQFSVQESDRDFLRFLWWEDGDIDKKPLEYRMKVHLFGAASSPGCANYGLKYLAKSHERDMKGASLFVQNDFYVDDGLTSLETEKEAIQIIQDARELCKDGGLHLHKFVSNRKAVIESIPTTERAADVQDLNLALEKLPIERALGVKWCVERDVFRFEVSIKDSKATRRNMLSIVASIFDPIGFLSPFTLLGKRILQEMCQKGINWDEPIPASIQPEWEKWVDDLHNLQIVQIPRPLRPADFGKPSRIELHHFSDASNMGYGQCSYIRFIGQNGIHCVLVMAKARVAPHKIVSIPRLELTAAVLSVKMSTFLKEELSLPIDDEYFWTDSRVVLGYINNEARRFHVFVANRVQTIRDSTQPCQWHYVSSLNNPADHASRGLSATGLMGSMWLKGPPFLLERELCFESVDAELQLGDPEVKSVRSLCTGSKNLPNILDLLKRFSSWSRLIAVTARLLRLSNGIKGTHSPSAEERQMAEKTILRLVQESAFKTTINSLNKTGKVLKTDPLYNLDVLLCDGLLCVGGRLRKADLSNRCKHPIVLPRNDHFSMLILANAHQQVVHQGRGMTLNQLRSSGYWIIGGSRVVAQFLRQCVICRKLRRPTECQKMADLPPERVVPSPPFLYCGMDCFGPFTVKNGRKEVKRWGILFTCMCTRAVHIEILDDMSTDAFINALRCFIAIRGTVKQIKSDQGTNFVGAKNELERLAVVDKLSDYLAEKQCEFIMNAPDASHTGGVWERQIKTVRSILNAVLLMYPGRLDDSSLRTMFYEVMSIVNGRPLSVSEIDNPDVIEPLTPNHILTSKANVPYPPPGNFVKEDLLLRKRWRRVQYLLQQFWTRWRKEYLSQIALRQKWHQRRRNIQVGDIVLVKDINSPRNQWPIAKVLEVTVDDDGLVRRAKVKLGQKSSSSASILERSVHKLVLLLEQE